MSARGLKCCECAADIDDKIVSLRVERWISRSGDGYGYATSYLTDAAVFCSFACAANYCVGNDGKPEVSP